MPFRRKRIIRATMGKEPIKHSHTQVSVIGNGSIVGQRGLIRTNAGERSADGSPVVIRDSSTTSTLVQVGDVVKYINIVLQTAVTTEGNDPQSQTQGWLEWGLVWRDEITKTIPTTSLGTKTLGDICMQMFRGDCIMTGQFPCSVNLPNVQEIKIKLPKKAIKWHLGDELTLYTIFRDADTTDLQTDTVKLVLSAFFKAYT